MSRLAPIGAPVAAALAAWLTQGTIGFTGAGGARIAVLPVSIAALLVAAFAAVIVIALRRAGASLRPLGLLAFLLLPWLPVPVPTAFLLWVRPLSLLIWAAVLLLMLVSRNSAPGLPRLRRPRAAAAGLARALFATAA